MEQPLCTNFLQWTFESKLECSLIFNEAYVETQIFSVIFKSSMQVVEYEAGVDEAGCGSLIGNLVAAAVILPKDFDLNGVNDSKKLSAKRRSNLYDRIMRSAKVGIGTVTREEIDCHSLGWARRIVFIRALDSLQCTPGSIVIDGNGFFDGYNNVPFECVVKADSTHASVAAASIVAKVTRDAQIHALCQSESQIAETYGWVSNMGYPTRQHINAIRANGTTLYHRMSFAPCRQGKSMISCE
jgi:ribonuclease HII